MKLNIDLKSKLINREIDSKTGLRVAIVLAVVISLIIFLPFIIIDKGCFLFLGDFNVQQIPFYQLAHKCVRD